jgi:hypothetical protein
MIYAALAIWLLLIIFAGQGIWRLWTGIVKPAAAMWVLFPGTVVSEMAYIFGSLITGGEVRRAKLISGRDEGRGGKAGGGGTPAGPATETAPRWKTLGPIIASLIAIVACAAAILAAHSLLGRPVIEKFTVGTGEPLPALLPKTPPTDWKALWEQLHGQIDLLRRMSQTLGQLNWFDWRVVLFVYLAVCLAVRLAPVNRPIRATLAAAVVVAAAVAAVAPLAGPGGGLEQEIWPLLSYVWTSLLFLLTVTLLLKGVIALAWALIGKGKVKG